MAKNAVVILNYNGITHLKNYLKNVESNTSSEAEIIIIDNASTDDSLNYLQKHFKQLKCISLPKNYGFAGGYNHGLKQVKADKLILLNSDVKVSPNWDIPLWKKLDQDHIGAVQPKILDLKNPTHYEYAGAAGGYVDKHYFPFCRGRIFSHLESKENAYPSSNQMFWASGAAFGIRQDVFEGIGGFDESFFAHMEEIDLCYRLQNKGYLIAYEEQSEVFHLGGGTLQMMSPFKTYLNYRNGLNLIVKNHYHSALWPLLFTRMFLDGLSAFNFCLRLLPQHSWAILKAHFYFYKGLISSLKTRRLLKKNWTGKKPKGLYGGSIIWAYFLKNVKSCKQLNAQWFTQ